jgi:hypothetical protein
MNGIEIAAEVKTNSLEVKKIALNICYWFARSADRQVELGMEFV